MDPALTSLLGVAVGGTVASGTSLVVERARLRRERERDDLAVRARLRTAGRLIFDELDESELHLDHCASKGYYSHRWEPPNVRVSRASWDAHRHTLAETAPDEIWWTVASVYAELSLLEQEIAAGLEEDRMMGVPEPHPIEGRKMERASVERTAAAVLLVNAAMRALHDFVGLPASSMRRPDKK